MNYVSCCMAYAMLGQVEIVRYKRQPTREQYGVHQMRACLLWLRDAWSTLCNLRPGSIGNDNGVASF